MFQTGDLIVYGSSGVCRVAAVGAPDMKATDKSRVYYTLQPIYGNGTIYTPVDTCVFMRPVISRRQAEELIHQIPSIHEEIYTNRNLVLLKGHYEDSLKTYECKDLIQLIKSIYIKNEDAVQCGRKPGQVDRKYMKRAEELLYGELAVALDMPRENVQPYIKESVTAMEE